MVHILFWGHQDPKFFSFSENLNEEPLKLMYVVFKDSINIVKKQ